MAAIGQIQPLWQSEAMGGVTPQTTTQTDGLPVFSDIFDAAIQSVYETDAEKTEAEYLLATGQLDNPATLSMASSKAQLSVQLLVQLRNKALDAYNEVARMSI